jgi:CRISPR/Cas system-associated endonuclease Cas1
MESYFQKTSDLRIGERSGHYDGLNNVFNFGYYVLKCRVHKALLKAKLEPYLGFLHSIQIEKPSIFKSRNENLES